jgi:glycosyltransferase involved in cell wall biosynthesis
LRNGRRWTAIYAVLFSSPCIAEAGAGNTDTVVSDVPKPRERGETSTMVESRTRRLLVITYHFPPDGAVGGLRWFSLTKYLARIGWDVHVLTAAKGADREHVSGVTVHVRERSRILNDRYNDWKATRVRPAQKGSAAIDVGPTTRPFVSRVRGAVGRWLVFPDHARGWILKAARVARQLQRQIDFDAVVTSGPPHSAHLAGLLATSGSRVRWYVDMRDPWTTGMLPGMTMTFHPLLAKLESLVLRRACGIIANTSEFAESLRRAQPRLKVAWIPNGIDVESLPSNSGQKFPGLSIAYVGTLYAGRDLSPILQAMAGLIAANPEAMRELKLRVAGHMNPLHAEHFKLQSEREGVSKFIDLLGVLPRVSALELLQRSHVAIVLAQNQPMQVPAKLYECMALGVPTLVIAENDSAAAREARRIGAWSREAADVASIRNLLVDLRSSGQKQVRLAADISYEGISRQMNDFLSERCRTNP